MSFVEKSEIVVVTIGFEGCDLSFVDDVVKYKITKILTDIKQKHDLIIHTYCILDDVLYLLAQASKQSESVAFWEEPIALLTKVCQDFHRDEQESHSYYCRIDKKSGDELVEGCIQLHLLPVRQGYALHAVDYWWSGYHEYVKPQDSVVGMVDTKPVLDEINPNPYIARRKFMYFHS